MQESQLKTPAQNVEVCEIICIIKKIYLGAYITGKLPKQPFDKANIVLNVIGHTSWSNRTLLPLIRGCTLQNTKSGMKNTLAIDNNNKRRGLS